MEGGGSGLTRVLVLVVSWGDFEELMSSQYLVSARETNTSACGPSRLRSASHTGRVVHAPAGRLEAGLGQLV